MSCSFHFGGDSFRFQEGMCSVGLVYPPKNKTFPQPMSNLPHVPRCQRLGSCLGGGPMSCRIVVAIGRQRQKKSLNQQASQKIKSNKFVHLHVLPKNTPPKSTQSIQSPIHPGSWRWWPWTPGGLGFCWGPTFGCVGAAGELSWKPLWRCIDIMEDCIFVSDVFTVDVLYKCFFLSMNNEAACLTLFSLELI